MIYLQQVEEYYKIMIELKPFAIFDQSKFSTTEFFNAIPLILFMVENCLHQSLSLFDCLLRGSYLTYYSLVKKLI